MMIITGRVPADKWDKFKAEVLSIDFKDVQPELSKYGEPRKGMQDFAFKSYQLVDILAVNRLLPRGSFIDTVDGTPADAPERQRFQVCICIEYGN